MHQVTNMSEELKNYLELHRTHLSMLERVQSNNRDVDVSRLVYLGDKNGRIYFVDVHTYHKFSVPELYSVGLEYQEETYVSV